MQTPAHIVPEWYFLPFYAILRAIPDKLGGVLFMFGAIAVLIRKKPNTKSKPNKAVHPSLEPDAEPDVDQVSQDSAREVMQEVESGKALDFVSTWEELPEGEWLPNDENGVNWYQDKEGKYWYSVDVGFKVWDD